MFKCCRCSGTYAISPRLIHGRKYCITCAATPLPLEQSKPTPCAARKPLRPMPPVFVPPQPRAPKPRYIKPRGITVNSDVAHITDVVKKIRIESFISLNSSTYTGECDAKKAAEYRALMARKKKTERKTPRPYFL